MHNESSLDMASCVCALCTRILGHGVENFISIKFLLVQHKVLVGSAYKALYYDLVHVDILTNSLLMAFVTPNYD